MSTPVSDSALTALVSAINAEQLAAFGYGALGPRLGSPAQISQAHACELAHRSLAATAMAMAGSSASSSSASPSASPGSYTLPGTATDAASALRLAAVLEQQCAASWRYVLAQLASTPAAGTSPASADSAWTVAAQALRDCAVRAVMWRRLTDAATASVPFPGI
jgi:Domain of unknown function (DUF4439)